MLFRSIRCCLVALSFDSMPLLTESILPCYSVSLMHTSFMCFRSLIQPGAYTTDNSLFMPDLEQMQKFSGAPRASMRLRLDPLPTRFGANVTIQDLPKPRVGANVTIRDPIRPNLKQMQLTQASPLTRPGVDADDTRPHKTRPGEDAAHAGPSSDRLLHPSHTTERSRLWICALTENTCTLIGSFFSGNNRESRNQCT